MSYELHVAKTHKIEYASKSFFNHGYAPVNTFLEKLYKEAIPEGKDLVKNQDDIRDADHLAFTKEDWRRMTMYLLINATEDKAFDKTAAKNLFVEYSVLDMAQFMLYVLENADRENGWIDLYWY